MDTENCSNPFFNKKSAEKPAGIILSLISQEHWGYTLIFRYISVIKDLKNGIFRTSLDVYQLSKKPYYFISAAGNSTCLAPLDDDLYKEYIDSVWKLQGAQREPKTHTLSLSCPPF
jgi:hypothetical protein